MNKSFKAFLLSLSAFAIYVVLVLITEIIFGIIIDIKFSSSIDRNLFYNNNTYLFQNFRNVGIILIIALIFRSQKVSITKISKKDQLNLFGVLLSILVGISCIIILMNPLNTDINSFSKFEKNFLIMPKMNILIGNCILAVLWEVFHREVIFSLLKGKVNTILCIMTASIYSSTLTYIYGNRFLPELFIGIIIGIIYFYSETLWYPIIIRVIITITPLFNITRSIYIFKYASFTVPLSLLIIMVVLIIYYKDYTDRKSQLYYNLD